MKKEDKEMDRIVKKYQDKAKENTNLTTEEYAAKCSKDYDDMIKEVMAIDKKKKITYDEFSDDDSYMSKVYEKQEDDLDDRRLKVLRECIKKKK